MLKALTSSNDSGDELTNILKIIEANSAEMKATLKGMRRRFTTGKDLSPTEPIIKFDDGALRKMLKCGQRMSLLVRSLYACSRQMQSQTSEVPSGKARELLNSSVDLIYESNDAGIDIIAKDVNEVMQIITDLSQSLHDGEWDTNEIPEGQKKLGNLFLILKKR